MLIYRPDKFEGAFRALDGASLWAYLQEEKTILRMETATYLGRPAIEPLSPDLLDRFGSRVAHHQKKQMIGHMTRQVLEARGFRLDRSGVRIKRPGNIFFSGSRYRHPDQ
ncbi:hypothetical protein [Sulfitobacter aestuariivivens]|uniref:Uncharacterized protein n=1 Tax=Sulfitobacter aestuariivivens TaxID=2766981 RepID=A0A927D539_9RHOB|nr:hypothetical protein [Sulfitobacter aestuariivivens]MBD3664393.1 hypothetical protein [Sulfitobacter aestuariivivens]